VPQFEAASKWNGDAVESISPLSINDLAELPVFKHRDDGFDFDGFLYHYRTWGSTSRDHLQRKSEHEQYRDMNDPRESKDSIIGTFHHGPPDLTDIDTLSVGSFTLCRP
jgi:hypothetical protein